MSLVVSLSKNDGGFFCQVWQLMSNYLLAKNFNLQFYVNDSQWMFCHTNGWRDYFTSLNILTPSSIIETPIHFNIDDSFLNQFTLNQYKDTFKEVFQFNDTLKERLQNTMNQYNLDLYDAIMIRRGDKMYGESDYISTETYVNKLLEKDTKKIFIQTDDYNAYLEVCELVKDKNIEVITTCPKTKFGCFVFNYAPEIGSTRSELNNEYLKNINTKRRAKSVNKYNASEMKEHVEEMLIGLQICLNSRYLVTDYQSNVTRYLVVNHPNYININDINLDFNIPMRCPIYGFIYMPQ